MKLFELEDNDILNGYYDPAQDEMAIQRPTKTRTNKLTLKHLNRLKRMRALKKLEDMKRHDLLGQIYAEPAADEGGGGGGSPF